MYESIKFNAGEKGTTVLGQKYINSTDLEML